MSNNSVTLHRVLKAAPEKIYRAFTESSALASWLPPHGFICVVHNMDLKPGGIYRMSFTNFSTGNGHSFGGKYLELKPNEFLRYTDQFDDPNLPGEMITSAWLRKVSCGTELKVIQEGIPAAIRVEMCYLGWQDSLEKLAKLVEPVIPDA
ncbi:MAG: SRPBCC family protein [Chitinophagales bacterium]